MRISYKKIIKLISLNFLVLFLLIFSPAIIFKLFSRVNIFKNNNHENYEVTDYPIFENNKLTKIVFKDMNSIKSDFRSFIGWRRKISNKRFTTINKPFNTRKSTGEKLNNSIWFFGGSTMWGYGVSNESTIPSLFYEKTGDSVFNFGEDSWDSRQSINQLINNLGEGYKPKTVIFFDGVNDTLHNCRSDNKNIPNYGRDFQIAKAINYQKNKINFISDTIKNFIISPYKPLLKNNYSSTNKVYDCHINHKKSKRIAKHLINNWYSAYLISKANKANFRAILQPTLFTSDVSYEYFSNKSKKDLNHYKKQLDIIYTFAREEIKNVCIKDKEFCNKIIDGSSWLFKKENIFFDSCHVTKEGNKIIAEKISISL